MRTADVAAHLDDLFRLDDYPPEDFAEIVEFCDDAGIPLAEYATPGFMRRHNGLMLANAAEIDPVYTLVFPSDEVLAEVERRAYGRPALVFTHHPMDFETSARGLMPIPTATLDRLYEGGISLYSAHAPLDCHDAVSTSRALARAIGVPATETFAGFLGGHAGVIGEIDPVAFGDFLGCVQRGCEIERLDTKQSHDNVRRVAVVAGGAAFPPLMQEAVDAGCDTYVTGDFRVRHGGPWAEEHRPEFDAFLEDVPLSLVGASHFATEALVLRHDLIPIFAELGLKAEFVPQDDPWR